MVAYGRNPKRETEMFPIVPATILVLLTPVYPEVLLAKAIHSRGSSVFVGGQVWKIRATRQITSDLSSGRMKRPPATFSTLIASDGRTRAEMDWEENERTVRTFGTFDGKQFRAWQNDVRIPLSSAAEATQEDARYLSHVCKLDPLTDRTKFRLSVRPGGKINGETCDVLRVESQGRKPIDLHIGRSTSLIQRVVAKRLGSDGVWYDLTEHRSEFKQMTGMNFATKVRIVIGDNQEEITVLSAEFIPEDRVTGLPEKAD